MFWGFFFGLGACGILSPQPEIKLAPPAMEGEVLTVESPGKSSPYSLSLRTSLGPPGSF